MKRKIHHLFLGLTTFFFIFLVVLDFFPAAINIQSKIIIFLIILFGIISVVTQDKDNVKSNAYISKIGSPLILTTLLVLLIIILTLMGGQSQSGVGIDNPVIWLLYLATIISVLFKKRKNVSNNS